MTSGWMMWTRVMRAACQKLEVTLPPSDMPWNTREMQRAIRTGTFCELARVWRVSVLAGHAGD
jgi:hypothetical protein